MVEASELDTSLIFRTLHNTARVFKNSIAEKVVEIEALSGDTNFEDLAPLVASVKGREVLDKGDLEYGIWTAGMIVGLISDIPDCGTLLKRIVADAEEIINARLKDIVQA